MSVASRLTAFGQTIFSEITALAAEHGAVNLGQGFPNFDGPEFVKEAAVRAIREGANQYAPSAGVAPLATAVAERMSAATGMPIDAEAHVTVTSGCTEALAATFLGLIEPGDEVVLIEPFYDSYPVCAAMASAVPSFVTLRPPGFHLEAADLAAVVGSRTRAVVVNTPHNPTGRVLRDDELEAVATVCRDNDLIAISDEVYEHIVFDRSHRSLATLPGMWERTVTLSSLGKTFSLTGWKVGWAVAPRHLTAGVRAAHQFLTFATATPLQHGAAAALSAPDGYFTELTRAYRRRRDLLCGGLADIGFDVFVPEGTYFALADHTRFGIGDDMAVARFLVEHAGVAVIPPSAFYHDPFDGSDLIRFAFCKDDDTLAEALSRLATTLG